jgi:hypothetical protein
MTRQQFKGFDRAGPVSVSTVGTVGHRCEGSAMDDETPRCRLGRMAHGPKLQLRSDMTLAIVGLAGDAPTIDAPQDAQSTAGPVLLHAATRRLEPSFPTPVAAAGRGAVSWVAYPKAKQLGTDLDRDVIRTLVQTNGLDTVRQVALDTRSALRLVSRIDRSWSTSIRVT